MIIIINEEDIAVIRMFIYIGQRKKGTQGTSREKGRSVFQEGSAIYKLKRPVHLICSFLWPSMVVLVYTWGLEGVGEVRKYR